MPRSPQIAVSPAQWRLLNLLARFGQARRILEVGTLIVSNHVVRKGAVADAASTDANVRGVRRYLELVAAEPRVQATGVQTVGLKGYDGFCIALVVA